MSSTGFGWGSTRNWFVNYSGYDNAIYLLFSSMVGEIPTSLACPWSWMNCSSLSAFLEKQFVVAASSPAKPLISVDESSGFVVDEERRQSCKE